MPRWCGFRGTSCCARMCGCAELWSAAFLFCPLLSACPGWAVQFLCPVQIQHLARSHPAPPPPPQVNQLLTEMDGFEAEQQGIVVMGATNRKDVLDAALTRAGRFDRSIEVSGG